MTDYAPRLKDREHFAIRDKFYAEFRSFLRGPLVDPISNERDLALSKVRIARRHRACNNPLDQNASCGGTDFDGGS